MRFSAPLILMTFLAACATLTEEQCRSGNWSGIGFNDGLNGRAVDYIGNHFEACSELGITPNVQAWQAGREQGLLRYCTPQNAYITGRNGDRFNQVCPIDQRVSLADAFDWGAEYYFINQEILVLTEEKFEIEIAVAGMLALPVLTPEQAAQLAQFQSRIRLIDLRLRRLRFQQERYAVLPFSSL